MEQIGLCAVCSGQGAATELGTEGVLGSKPHSGRRERTRLGKLN